MSTTGWGWATFAGLALVLLACGGESIADANIKAVRGKFRPCYQAALAGNPDAEGRIVVRIMVGADGSVLSMEVGERSGNLPEATERCIVDAVRLFRWEPPGRTSMVNVPVTFRKQK
ncbi:MAG: TonB family protein [Polyangiaceae bacterium]|nr:TonB family protein [Polyangiaceae bacterium]